MVTLATALERHRPTRRQLAAWATREPALAGLTYDELRAGQLDPDVPTALKDERLAALIRLARVDGQAGMTLLACMAPALHSLARRYRRSLGLDAWPATVAAMWTAARAYPLDRRPAWVANNLRHATRTRLTAVRKREQAWSRHTAPYRPGLDVGTEPADWGAADVLRSAVTAGVITTPVAELIETTRVHGHSLASVARRRRVGYEALKKRRQRGEAALATWLTREHRSTA